MPILSLKFLLFESFTSLSSSLASERGNDDDIRDEPQDDASSVASESAEDNAALILSKLQLLMALRRATSVAETTSVQLIFGRCSLLLLFLLLQLLFSELLLRLHDSGFDTDN